MKKKRPPSLLIISILSLHCAHTPVVAGYNRCPDPAKFPGLACCKKGQLFSPDSGGCTNPENLQPKTPSKAINITTASSIVAAEAPSVPLLQTSLVPPPSTSSGPFTNLPSSTSNPNIAALTKQVTQAGDLVGGVVMGALCVFGLFVGREMCGLPSASSSGVQTIPTAAVFP